jgi:hypothetical protein
MVSAFVTAPPPAALPPLGTLLVALGMHIVFAVLIGALVVGAAVLLQHAVCASSPWRRVERGRARRARIVPHAA